jgi:hypothetical protein
MKTSKQSSHGLASGYMERLGTDDLDTSNVIQEFDFAASLELEMQSLLRRTRGRKPVLDTFPCDLPSTPSFGTLVTEDG